MKSSLAIVIIATCALWLGKMSQPAKQPPAAQFEMPSGESVTAPVDYDQLMLIISNEDGVAAFVFTQVFNTAEKRGVKYRYRFLPKGGAQETNGEGQVFENLGDIKESRTVLRAGPLHLVWSAGSARKGWVYYVPEKLRVQIADSGSFEKIELKRFQK